MSKGIQPEDINDSVEQNIFWKITCTHGDLWKRADVVMSHVKGRPQGPLADYEAIDIRIRRNANHKLGPGFSIRGVRLKMEEAASLWKALGHFLRYRNEEEE